MSASRLKSKPIMSRGLKFLVLSLPLLFLAPILITMGFKLLSRGGSFLLLGLGVLLGLAAILLATQGIRLILKSLFTNEV